jgi:hypothetical protein
VRISGRAAISGARVRLYRACAHLECAVSSGALAAHGERHPGRAIRLAQPMANGVCVLSLARCVQSGDSGLGGDARESLHILHRSPFAGCRHNVTAGLYRFDLALLGARDGAL